MSEESEWVPELPSFEEIRKWIVETRERLGWTQTKLACAAEISRPSLAKIESGKYKNYEAIEAVVNTLGQEIRKRCAGEKVLTTTAEEIMASPVTTVKAEETLPEVWKKMHDTAFSQFPVESRRKIVGSITERGINSAINEYREKAERIKVRDVMEDPFPIVPSSTPLPLIIQLLQRYQAVLVSKKGRVVGIITNTDIGKIFTSKKTEV